MDKNNNLIFDWFDHETNNDKYYLQTIAFSSLDIALEKKKNSSELYLGHLVSVDDFEVLCLNTNTGSKLLLICDENPNNETFYKDLLIALNSLYVNVRINPFQSTSNCLKSKKLPELIRETIKKHASGFIFRR